MAMEIPVHITERALLEIRHIMNNKNIPDQYGLRIGVKGGGCAGVQHILGFDTPKEGDATYKAADIPVHVAKKDTMYLIGLELDFYEGDDAKGFLFAHPEAN